MFKREFDYSQPGILGPESAVSLNYKPKSESATPIKSIFIVLRKIQDQTKAVITIDFNKEAEYKKVSPIIDRMMEKYEESIGLFADSYSIWIADTDKSRVNIQKLEPLITSLKESGVIDDDTRDMILRDLKSPIKPEEKVEGKSTLFREGGVLPTASSKEEIAPVEGKKPK